MTFYDVALIAAVGVAAMYSLASAWHAADCSRTAARYRTFPRFARREQRRAVLFALVSLGCAAACAAFAFALA